MRVGAPVAAPVGRVEIEPINASAEWHTRVELAAASRILAHYGFGAIDGQVCARVPGERDAFLIKPLSILHEEATASALVKYDVFGNPRQSACDERDRRELAICGGLSRCGPTPR